MKIDFFTKRYSSKTSFFKRFLAFLFFLFIIYSGIFKIIMLYEGHEHSWITAFYWTLTVMSTLGFGDITFSSDVGKLFSILVLLSGILLLLVLLPSIFMQHFYLPLLESTKKERLPHELPETMTGHVILVGVNSLTTTLADDLKDYDFTTFILSSDPQTTSSLLEQGYNAVLGEHDDAQTYRKLRLSNAAMLVAMDTDQRNSNIIYTAHFVAERTQLVARAEHSVSIDILKLAGATRVYQFYQLLGAALARRVLNPAKPSSTIGKFNELVIAEAPVMRTNLVGKTVIDAGLRNYTGVNIVGLWQRGHFSLPNAKTVLTENTVIVTAGTEDQTKSLDEFLHSNTLRPEINTGEIGVLILGGGRVGQAAADWLKRHGIPATMVDQKNIDGYDNIVCGDAANIDILEKAGIRTASSVIITTHDDDTNIYLTIYCRHLRPDIQIVSRAISERNVEILHSAGADLVLSLTTMISNTLLNRLSPGRVMVLTDSLNIFRVNIPKNLIGVKLADSRIRAISNCSVVAIGGGDHGMILNPPPDYTFLEKEELYLIGDSKAEERFTKNFCGQQ